MLNSEQVQNNKERFLSLINSVNRPGSRMDILNRQLIESDFFVAPASTKYHNAYIGGLCEHSLQVYDALCKLNETFNYGLNSESMIIVALLHDFEKMGRYKKEFKNVKVYSDNGKKKDPGGNFDWEVQESWATKPSEERFVFSNHETTSAFMANTFIPLTTEEWVAILHHMGGLGYDSAQNSFPEIYERYPLALALHMADMISAYDDKNR